MSSPILRSQHADYFNHDEDAPDYDDDVRNEAHPIRAGYAKLLAWVAGQADVRSEHEVVDLGCGTGNLSALLPSCERLWLVDISSEMLTRAQSKLVTRPEIQIQQDDLLSFLADREQCFDRILSTYAIHHLTAAEKASLFQLAANSLREGGRLVMGDLMFTSAAHQQHFIDALDEENCELAEAIEDEFFWHLDEDTQALKHAGFDCQVRQFSALSWGICATLNSGSSS